MKARIGKAYDKKNKRDLYQLQFKLDGECRYKALSYDAFEKKSDAKEALDKHLSGEREYTYAVSIVKTENIVRGNCVSIKTLLVCHVMTANTDLPTSHTWIKIKEQSNQTT